LIPHTIRPLRSDDLPALKHAIDSTGLFPSEMLDDMTAPFLEGAAGNEIWLTLAAPEPVAVAYCVPERMTIGTWNLLLIAVGQSRQGQGLGSALMAHVESVLAGDGQRILLVETSGLPEFERTRRFYSGLNYEVEARIRDFYRHGDDKIIFRKALDR
jgi:ribosomal protein S18 acetylase RimI-like enzyme